MSDIKDISLAPSGERKIAWVSRNMPVIGRIAADFERDKPLAGLKVTLSVHLEAKTAWLCRVLEKGGDSLYRNRSNTQPIEAADAQIHQGALESSNVNPLIEITNLVEISRAYESVSRMIDNTNDLSRRAVERLGKAA